MDSRPLDAVLEALGYARPEWMLDALCREYPDLPWIPQRRGQDVTPCLEVCRRCIVVDACRAWALADASLDYGVLGGQTARQRKAARRLIVKGGAA